MGGHGRVDVRELDVKQVEAVLIRGASGALDQGREEVLGREGRQGLAGLPPTVASFVLLQGAVRTGREEERRAGAADTPVPEKLNANLCKDPHVASFDSWHKRDFPNWFSSCQASSS